MNEISVTIREVNDSSIHATCEGFNAYTEAERPFNASLAVAMAASKHFGGDAHAVPILLDAVEQLFTWMAGEDTVAGDEADREFNVALEKYIKIVEAAYRAKLP